jgi:hypothetical protein
MFGIWSLKAPGSVFSIRRGWLSAEVGLVATWVSSTEEHGPLGDIAIGYGQLRWIKDCPWSLLSHVVES